jgi:hypothetical protein
MKEGEIMPDISVTQLADMVSLYIYYQYGITKEEAKKALLESEATHKAAELIVSQVKKDAVTQSAR